jgi:hypothetical protein
MSFSGEGPGPSPVLSENREQVPGKAFLVAGTVLFMIEK